MSTWSPSPCTTALARPWCILELTWAAPTMLEHAYGERQGVVRPRFPAFFPDPRWVGHEGGAEAVEIGGPGCTAAVPHPFSTTLYSYLCLLRVSWPSKELLPGACSLGVLSSSESSRRQTSAFASGKSLGSRKRWHKRWAGPAAGLTALGRQLEGHLLHKNGTPNTLPRVSLSDTKGWEIKQSWI